MVTGKPLKALITCQPQGHTEPRTGLLQLAHHTVSDAGAYLSVQGVHHSLDKVDLVADGHVDEICIHQDLIGWDEGGVVAKEERRGRLLDMFYTEGGFFGCDFLILFLGALEPWICGTDDLFDLGKLFQRFLVSLKRLADFLGERALTIIRSYTPVNRHFNFI